MKKTTLILSLIITTFGQINAQNLETDLKEMLTWFTGEFDNFQQVWQEKEDKMTDSLMHERIHSIFLPVKMPALGEHVFFVKQYMDGDTDKIYRMRVYNLSVDKMENAIRLDIFSFKEKVDETRFKSANHTPSVLEGLKPENFTSTTGCGVFWKRENGVFIGSMKPKACNFISKRSNKKVFITDSLKLTPNEIWIRDEAEDENGNYVFGHKGKIHHKLLRCRPFKGWIAIAKEGVDRANITDADYIFIPNLRLHDQGWKTRVVLPDGTVTPYTVELSQVVFQKTIAVMKLAIYEEGKTKAITYNWTNPEAERIGINLRWIQVGLTEIKEGLINRETIKK
jgi:CpeT/CpcT family (DUF1001)